MTDIFFLAGAPAVGKSTTAHALAARFQKSIHIPVDDLREMVVSGLVLPGSDWNQELIDQLVLVRKSVTHMALIYNEAGYTVVIDDFWDPNSRLTEYSRLFSQPKVHQILLLPTRQVAEARNLRRSDTDEENEYLAFGIHLVYNQVEKEEDDIKGAGWLLVDTTDKTVEETVDHILRLVS